MSSLTTRKINITGVGGTITVLLNIKGTLPITHIPSFTEERHTFNKVTVAKVVPTNTIDSRYTFICDSYNNYNDMSLALYYDTEYKDIILVPNPDYYDTEGLNNTVLHIEGYCVGKGDDTVFGNGLTLNTEKTILPAIADPITSSDQCILNMHGFNNRSISKKYTTITTDIGVFYEVNNIAFIKINKNTLFGPDADLPMATILQLDTQKFRIKNIGPVNKEYFFIPIPN